VLTIPRTIGTAEKSICAPAFLQASPGLIGFLKVEVKDGMIPSSSFPGFSHSSYAFVGGPQLQFPKSYPNDPQDRIIGATAIVEGIRLLTHNKMIVKSGLVPLAA
jgi:hypothetical protein